MSATKVERVGARKFGAENWDKCPAVEVVDGEASTSRRLMMKRDITIVWTLYSQT